MGTPQAGERSWQFYCQLPSLDGGESGWRGV